MEDIREGIKEALVNARAGGYRGEYFNSDDATDALIQKLHSQGVVRRVKCPHCVWSQFKGGESVGMTPCFNCNSSGYVAVEPLVEGAWDYITRNAYNDENVEPLIEVCPTCSKEPHLCKCPTINRGSFAKYVEEE